MSDLKLVPTHEPTELERMLIDAAAKEKPSDEHKLRVREALGLALPLAALPATAATAGAKTAAGTSATAGAGASASSTAGTVALAKALVGGVVSASAVGAVVFALVTPSKAPAPAPVAPAPVQVQAAPVAKAAPAAQVATPEVAAVPVSELPLVKDEPKAKPVREQKTAAPSVSTEDDLRQQIVLIESARSHVAQNNPWPALQALDSYAAKFKGGSFDQEAAVLRIKAVEQTGDRERASGLAKSFLEKNPTSPHVDRVRRVAEPAEPR